MNAAEFPNNEPRILFNNDEEQWIGTACVGKTDPEEIKRTLEEDIVDELAEGRVDTLTWCLWSTFRCVGRSRVAEKRSGWAAWDCWDPLYEVGYDPVQIIIDRCHQRGMGFIAGMRMNDRHGGSEFTFAGRFIKEHPEWQLSSLKPGMNYAYEPVRQKVLAYIEDLLAGHEVDGIEFDYMRWCHMFEPGEGQQKAHLLTDFTRKARELLDAAAQRRGRSRLVLGVRVPQTLAECDYLGFDVASWIKEGLVDYVVPSDFFYTDFNAKTEDFVKLAEGTDCKIYPAISPVICWGNNPGAMTLANHRAAAQNFYAYGADGLETYNYQFHWHRRVFAPGPVRKGAYMWPAALGYLRDLRDPQTVSERDRHYLFYPLWDRAAPSGSVHDDRIRLDRAQPGAQGSQRFRVAEDLSNPKLRATMEFKAVGLAEDESLEIQLNGTPAPDKCTRRHFYADGQNKWQGRELPAFHLYVIDLDEEVLAPAMINGDNELTVRLIPTEAQSEGTVTIDELEVYVYVTP